MKALPMTVSEAILQHKAEKKRIKQGILAESEEKMVFSKTLYLPYLTLSYRYLASKGHFSKQPFTANGRSVVMALREVNMGFLPELARLTPHLMEVEAGSGLVVRGIDSTVLVNERLEELKMTLSEYDTQLGELSKQYDALPKTGLAKQDVKENIDHLSRTREARWKMFADGLRLPSKIDLETFELLEGSLFYLPYFMVRFVRDGESRFLVWDREGKEEEVIADELMKNDRFRELVLSNPDESESSEDQGSA